MKKITLDKAYACKHYGNPSLTLIIITDCEKSHNREKPYSCKYCGKTFTNFSLCMDHERIHTGDKSYNQCENAFTCSCHLNIQGNIHSREKLYSDEHCAKTFHTSSWSNLHAKNHTGKKNCFCVKHGKLFI